MKKYLIWGSVIIVGILGMAYWWIKPYFTTAPSVLTASQTSCVVDSDCVAWSPGCEDCAYEPINKSSYVLLDIQKRAYCTKNPPKTMCDMSKPEVKCAKEKCVFVVAEI